MNTPIAKFVADETKMGGLSHEEIQARVDAIAMPASDVDNEVGGFNIF